MDNSLNSNDKKETNFGSWIFTRKQLQNKDMSVKLRKKGNVLVTKLVTDCMDHRFVYNMNCFHIEKKKIPRS